MSNRLPSQLVAEFLGALAIVFFGCGAITVGHFYNNTDLLGQVPWVFGLTVGVMVYAVGHISGAHFNPAVTLAFAATRRFPVRHVPFYWGAQFLGALAGALLIRYLLPEATVIGVTSTTLPIVKALMVEAILTFFLMFVIISVATDSRAIGTMAGASIGVVITVDAFLGGSLTGASMNPARSWAPAFVAGDTTDLWIYLIGPAVGACCAAWLYELIRKPA